MALIWEEGSNLALILQQRNRQQRPFVSLPLQATGKVRVAVIREEGSNGDREMGAAVWAGGMEPWDVTMSDLLNGRASLDSFQGQQALPCQHCRLVCLLQPGAVMCVMLCEACHAAKERKGHRSWVHSWRCCCPLCHLSP